MYMDGRLRLEHKGGVDGGGGGGDGGDDGCCCCCVLLTKYAYSQVLGSRTSL